MKERLICSGVVKVPVSFMTFNRWTFEEYVGSDNLRYIEYTVPHSQEHIFAKVIRHFNPLLEFYPVHYEIVVNYSFKIRGLTKYRFLVVERGGIENAENIK